MKFNDSKSFLFSQSNQLLKSKILQLSICIIFLSCSKSLNVKTKKEFEDIHLISKCLGSHPSIYGAVRFEIENTGTTDFKTKHVIGSKHIPILITSSTNMIKTFDVFNGEYYKGQNTTIRAKTKDTITITVFEFHESLNIKEEGKYNVEIKFPYLKSSEPCEYYYENNSSD